MKHMLLHRRQDLCGHVWRWLSLPNTVGQPAGKPLGDKSGSGCLSLVHLPFHTAPAPNTQASRAQLRPTRLSRDHNGWQMAKGGQAYKGGRDSNFERINDRPGHSAAPHCLKNHGRTPKLLRLNCAFFSHNDPLAGQAGSSVAPWRVSVRATSSRSGPQVPPLPGQKPRLGSHSRARVCAFERARPERTRTETRAQTQRTAGTAGCPGSWRKPSPGAARERNPALGAEENDQGRKGSRAPAAGVDGRQDPRRVLTC